MSIIIQPLPDGLRDWANKAYGQIGFLPSPADDYIALATVKGVNAGVGRLTFLGDGSAELGGMYVFDAFKGKGLAKLIISHLLSAASGKVVYCLPFEHLRRLYESCGFNEIEPDSGVPSKVAEKHAWCNQHYPARVLLMALTSRGPVA